MSSEATLLIENNENEEYTLADKFCLWLIMLTPIVLFITGICIGDNVIKSFGGIFSIGFSAIPFVMYFQFQFINAAIIVLIYSGIMISLIFAT